MGMTRQIRVTATLIGSLAFLCSCGGPAETPEARLLRLSGEAHARWQTGDRAHVDSLLAEIRSIAPEHEALDERYDFLPGECVRIFHRHHGHPGPVMSVAVSPDGRFVATGGMARRHRLFELNDIFGPVRTDHVAAIFTFPDSELVHAINGLAPPVNRVVFSPDRRFLITGAGIMLGGGPAEPGLTNAVVWSVEDGTPVRVFDVGSERVNDVAITPDGEFAVTASSDGTVKLWNMSDGSLVRSLCESNVVVTCVAVSLDGRYVFSADSGAVISVRRVADGTLERSLPFDAPRGEYLVASPDGRYLAASYLGDSMRLWNLSTWTAEHTLRGMGSRAPALAFSPDGRYLAVATARDDNCIEVFTVPDFRSVWRFCGQNGAINALATSPDGRYIVSGNQDGSAAIWRSPW